MNKPNQQQPHSKNTLEALADARIANLTENHWTPVRPGDIAELRRANTYALFELSSFATTMKRDERGNVTDLLFEIWRRRKPYDSARVIAAIAGSPDAAAVAHQARLETAPDQRARNAEGKS